MNEKMNSEIKVEGSGEIKREGKMKRQNKER